MRRKALLIGVEGYRDKLTSPFEFARTDAHALAGCLADRHGFDDVRLLADEDGPHAPDLEVVKKALDELALELQPEDFFLFGFFGHGVEKNGEGYLLLHDSRQAVPEENGLSLKALRDSFAKIEATRRAVLIDAFRSSPQPWNPGAGNLLDKAFAGQIMRWVQATPANTPGRTVLLSACRPGQRGYAWQERGRGVFAAALIEALEEPARRDAGLDMGKIANAVAAKVREWSLNNPRGGPPQMVWHEQFGGPAPVAIPRFRPEGHVQAIKTAEQDVDPETNDTAAVVEVVFPPIPSDILVLERELSELENDLQRIEEGSHPSVADLYKKYKAAKDQLDRANAALAATPIDLDPEADSRLRRRIETNPEGSLTQYCAIVPEADTESLLPYIQRLRELTRAKRDHDNAKRVYVKTKTEKTDSLEEKIEEVRRRHESHQSADLRVIIDILIAGSGLPVEFPVDIWILHEPLLRERFPRWNSRALLAKAELHYAERLYALAVGFARTGKREEDRVRAIELLRRAADLGDVRARTDLADRYRDGDVVQHDPAIAAGLYRRAATNSHALAQYRLGWCYYSGFGVRRDRDAAFQWFYKAARQGFALAQYMLGWWFAFGDDVKRDMNKAVQFLEEAASRGHAESEYMLGSFYVNGGRLGRDPIRAFQWFRKAANRGHVGAQARLAECYEYGQGIDESQDKALRWHEKAAREGHPDSQFALGCACFANKSAERDLQTGVQWFMKAAVQGHAGAQHNLAACYQTGRGVEKDPHKAAEWYGKAAALGHANSQYALARLFAAENEMEDHSARAIGWCRRAAHKGHVKAQVRLASHYLSSQGVEQDYEEAVKWLAQAAKAGDAAAQYNLGSCYYNGIGVEKNSELALSWLRKSQTQGHAAAGEALERIQSTMLEENGREHKTA